MINKDRSTEIVGGVRDFILMNRNLLLIILLVLIGVIICTTVLLSTSPIRPEASSTPDVRVYQNGSAAIIVNSTSDIVQLREDVVTREIVLKEGTLIIPGNGSPVHYNYPRHDYIIK